MSLVPTHGPNQRTRGRSAIFASSCLSVPVADCHAGYVPSARPVYTPHGRAASGFFTDVVVAADVAEAVAGVGIGANPTAPAATVRKAAVNARRRARRCLRRARAAVVEAWPGFRAVHSSPVRPVE